MGCEDAAGQYYECWSLDSALPDKFNFSVGNSSKCGCPECEHVCSQYKDCVGYHYYCCPEGVRCFGSASVLFTKGTRPEGDAPQHFTSVGHRGFPMAGENFPGSGRIQKASGE